MYSKELEKIAEEIKKSDSTIDESNIKLYKEHIETVKYNLGWITRMVKEHEKKFAKDKSNSKLVVDMGKLRKKIQEILQITRKL